MREEESLEIDRQMEELMLPDSGNGKKKKDKKNQGRKRDGFHPIQSFRRAGKIKKAGILMAGAAAVFIFSRLTSGFRNASGTAGYSGKINRKRACFRYRQRRCGF